MLQPHKNDFTHTFRKSPHAGLSNPSIWLHVHFVSVISKECWKCPFVFHKP